MKSYGSDGWSWKNILIGLALVVGGRIIGFLDGISAFFTAGDSTKIPAWFYPGLWLSAILMALGSFGFWFVVPAFQKWGKTKPWLAWTFLAIAVLILFILYFYSFKG